MLTIIILAAGKGTRMKDPNTPKVCQNVKGKTMIEHVVKTAKELNPGKICIIISEENSEKIRKVVNDSNIIFIEQKEVNGTGSAVLSAETFYQGQDILVLLGDVPFLTSKTLRKIVQSDNSVILGFLEQDFTNKFGRIIHKEGIIDEIVEYSEATEEQRKITSVNSGILYLKREYTHLLRDIKNDNSKREYYLTDIVKICKDNSVPISYIESDKQECLGINTKEELIKANNS